MDNLAAHQAPGIERLLNQAGAELRYLPPDSPDFNPIELMWSKVKTSLRAAKARTQEELWRAIAQVLSHVTPQDQGETRKKTIAIIHFLLRIKPILYSTFGPARFYICPAMGPEREEGK
jgi:hypothetical protein